MQGCVFGMFAHLKMVSWVQFSEVVFVLNDYSRIIDFDSRVTFFQVGGNYNIRQIQRNTKSNLKTLC